MNALCQERYPLLGDRAGIRGGGDFQRRRSGREIEKSESNFPCVQVTLTVTNQDGTKVLVSTNEVELPYLRPAAGQVFLTTNQRRR